MSTKKHPIQPLEKDDRGVLRFKKNAIVEYLLENGGIDMNELADLSFAQEDREQFAQLIGCSLGVFADLSYTSSATLNAIDRMVETGETADEARVAVLEALLANIKCGLRTAACLAFDKHPDDLQ